MGARGPKPTPTAILKSRGSWRANERTGEPTASALTVAPPCPARLKGPARRVWKETAPRLVALGVLTESDLDALEDYCAARAEFLALDKHVADNLDALRDAKGFPIAVAMRNQARAAMNKLAEVFGLTPASRSRLRVAEPAADDPMEAFFTRSPN